MSGVVGIIMGCVINSFYPGIMKMFDKFLKADVNHVERP